MFYQISVSPQVKRWAIITYKHGIYKLSHEFPNNLRSYEISRKCHKQIERQPSMKAPPTPAENPRKRPKPIERQQSAQPPAKIKALPIPVENH